MGYSKESDWTTIEQQAFNAHIRRVQRVKAESRGV